MAQGAAAEETIPYQTYKNLLLHSSDHNADAVCKYAGYDFGSRSVLVYCRRASHKHRCGAILRAGNPLTGHSTQMSKLPPLAQSCYPCGIYPSPLHDDYFYSVILSCVGGTNRLVVALSERHDLICENRVDTLMPRNSGLQIESGPLKLFVRASTFG